MLSFDFYLPEEHDWPDYKPNFQYFQETSTDIESVDSSSGKQEKIIDTIKFCLNISHVSLTACKARRY